MRHQGNWRGQCSGLVNISKPVIMCMHVYVAVLMECQSLMAAIDGSIIQEIVYTILWVSN